MLYAIGDPLSFGLLVASFVLCVTLVGWVTALVARRQGEVSVRREGRTRPDPRRHLDPYGSVAGAIAGVGWAHQLELVRRRRPVPDALLLLTGPVVVLVAGLSGLAAFGALQSPLSGASSLVLQQGIGAGTVGQRAWLLASLMATYVGALSLVPLPPLPGGQLLFRLVPRTPGWQRAELQLVERGIGTAVLLALLLIPLGSPQALLPSILDSLLSPLVRLVTGG